MGVGVVLRAEIAADEEVLGDELTLNGYGVHGGDLRKGRVVGGDGRRAADRDRVALSPETLPHPV
jgi:hypothetical protein